MEKLDLKPTRSISLRRIRTQAEWKVETHMIRARLPTRASTRSFISAAALLVKVIARIEPGCALRSLISQAMRRVRTRVLPEPAPATTSSGAPACVTAARWGSLRPSRSGWSRCSKRAWSAGASMGLMSAPAYAPGATDRSAPVWAGSEPGRGPVGARSGVHRRPEDRHRDVGDRQREQAEVEALRDARLAHVDHHEHQDHQADRELDADLGVVGRAEVLEHADEQQAGDEGRPGAVAHQRVHPLRVVAHLHEEASEEGGITEDVDEEQHQPQGLHADTLVNRPDDQDRRFLCLGAGRTT